MTKNIISLTLILFLTQISFAQLKVTPSGNVGIGTNSTDSKLYVHSTCGDWGQALTTKIQSKSACAYNLWNTYYNQDVFFVCGEGWLWSKSGGYFGSDSTMKEDIQPLNSSLSLVTQLNGVKYKYKEKNSKLFKDEKDLDKEKKNEEYRLGLIAQEVEKVVPEVVKTMPDSTKAIAYTDLIAVLVEAVKEQQVQIESLQTIVHSQKESIISLQEQVTNCCETKNNEKKSKSKSSNIEQKCDLEDIDIIGVKLDQNTPNPFTENTVISYVLPKNTKSARLIIHNMNGIEIKSYDISGAGYGSITISGSELQAGIYLYTLLIDNNLIDTKRMLLTSE